jgi:hypothetical protein
MQASNDISIKNSNELPFVIVENLNQQDKGNITGAHLSSWDFEISAGNKNIALTLIANDYQAALSDLVPVAHRICDMINQHAVENETECGNGISCKKGCGSCCSYMVSLSSAEAFHLQKHILSLPGEKRKPILHSFLRAARKIAANKVPPILDTTIDESECLKAISSWYQKMEIKCPFIKENACSEYVARPLVCREHLVTSPPKCCIPNSRQLTEVVELPISTAETLMHISNRLEGIPDEAVILPLTMVWCTANAVRGEKTYPSRLLAEHFIEAISAKTPAMA